MKEEEDNSVRSTRMEEDRYYSCHGTGTATRPKSTVKVVAKKGIVKSADNDTFFRRRESLRSSPEIRPLFTFIVHCNRARD